MKRKSPITDLVKALKEDKDYYYTWQSTIAVQFQDECVRRGYKFPDLHEISNDAAKSFLQLLIKK